MFPTRRQLLGALSASAATGAAVAAAPEAIKPKRLAAGDRIALVAPSGSSWEDEDVRAAIELVESLGFRVKPGRHIFERNAYLAGTDRQRAEDLNAAFADTDVNGIVAMRGGYGAQRILPLLDYDVIRANPKVLLGYSDITALLNSIHRRTGLVTFHGAMAGGGWSEYALEEFQKVVQRPTPRTAIAAPPPFAGRPGLVERENRITRLVPGKARGRLVGGNLTLLSTLMGTPYEPQFEGRILFFEDVGESPYRIDRMLTHLWLAGALEKCAGIVAGKFTEAEPSGSRSRGLEEILRERLEPLGIPALRGLMIGHVKEQAVIPLGVEAELDVGAGTLTLLETAVA